MLRGRSAMSRPYTGSLVCLFGLFLAPLRAQVTAVAQVSGIVTDQADRAIVNAEVSITQTDKAVTRNTITDASGQYVFTELPVGPYRLEVKAQGFKDYVQS